MTTTTFYSLELEDGIAIVQYVDSYIYRSDFVSECLRNIRRFYKIVNPYPAYVGYSYALCDNASHTILCKKFPLRPQFDSSFQTIPYNKVHITSNPIEADLFYRENHISEQRENYILNGLAALQGAIQALDQTERILAAPSSTFISSSSVTTQPSLQNQNKKVQTQARISKLMIADALASNATCPITTNPLTLTNAVCVAPCYHIFEREAISKWLETKDTCPECRQVCSL